MPATVSPAFTFSGVGTSLGLKLVAASTSFSATLDSIAGINDVAWSITGTDETTDAGDYTLTPSGTKGETVTFTSGAAGTAGILSCTVNSGVDPQTGSPSTTMTATAKWYVALPDGGEVGCVNETTESDPTFGTAKLINRGLRRLGGVAIRVRIQLIAGALQSTAAADGSGASLTTRPIHVASEYTGATSVTFWAYAGRVDVQATYHVELYNETNSVVVSNLSSSTTPSTLSGDVTASMLTAAEKVYSVRAWRSDPAWAPTTAYTTSPLSVVTNDGGKVYKCTGAGTSAGAGGPTGTGTGIADGGAIWDYVSGNAVAVSQAELRIS